MKAGPTSKALNQSGASCSQVTDNKVTPLPTHAVAFSPSGPLLDEFIGGFHHYVSSGNCFTDNFYNFFQVGPAVAGREGGIALQELLEVIKCWEGGAQDSLLVISYLVQKK